MINILLSYYYFQEDWAKDTLKNYINKNDKVVIVPFSFDDDISNSSEWENAYNRENDNYKEVVEPFLEYGIDENKIIWLNYFEDTEEEIKRIVESSNIIFFTGGLTDRAIERVIEKGLLNYIDKCRVVIGASAGALMQLVKYFIIPYEGFSDLMYFNGLGLINTDFYIVVHYKNTEFHNNCIKIALKEKTDTIYAIGDRGGIVIDNENLLIFGDVTIFKNK